MAFFSNSTVHDLELCRKRSTSIGREKSSTRSIDSGQRPSIDEGPRWKRSISSSSSSPKNQEVVPPLPTPVSAGRGRSDMSLPTAEAERSQTKTSFDQSSTPIPFSKQTRRDSPVALTKLLTSGPTAECWIDPHYPGPSRAASPPLTGSDRRVATSPLLPSSYQHVPTKDKEHPQLFSPKSDSEWPMSPLEDRNPHSLPNTQSSTSRKNPCDTSMINLPTPISPVKGQTTFYSDSGPAPAPFPHARSLGSEQTRGGSPTARSAGSAPCSTRSSVRRGLVPAYDQSESAGAPGLASSHGGRTTNSNSPTRDVVLMQPVKRPRNVLRKPSITRNQESRSLPTSDTEKKAKLPRPRANSIVISPVQLSGGTIFDVSQPLPTTALDLTPAGEILAAYQESQRIANVPPFQSSGALVALGASNDVAVKENPNPRISQWRGPRSGEEDNMTTSNSVTVLTKTLTKKLSMKWGRGPEKRHQDSRMCSVSGPDDGKLSPPEASENRFVTKPVDMHIGASPNPRDRVSQSGGRNADGDGEGRVWEDSVGDWAWRHKPDSNGYKDIAKAPNAGRLWRLVKRFSSGNLKEKRAALPRSPPPVPPLPREFTQRHDYTLDGGEVGEVAITYSTVPGTTGRFMQHSTNVPSPSIPRPKNPSFKKVSPSHRQHETDSGPTSSPSGSQFSAPRRWRSATTRSSSPSSGTTGFFSRSRSSSTSSCGETVPPVPSVPPARADNWVGEKGEDSGLSRRNSSKNPKPHYKSRDDSSVGSVSIPWFNTQNSINKFIPKSKRPVPPPLTTTYFAEYEPVRPQVVDDRGDMPSSPRPVRNSHRLGSHSISVSTHASSKHSVSNVIPVQDASESELTDTGGPQSLGRSARKARPRSLSAGAIILETDTSNGASKLSKSTMTYREMTTDQNHLTEQEKNEKWEDLLKRSDKAGGTLHVGSPTLGGLTLWSDRSSMAASVTLDQF